MVGPAASRRRLSTIARAIAPGCAAAATTDSEPFLPVPLLPGGIVTPLFESDAPFVNAARIHEPEVYNGGQWEPGEKIHGITNIHNPSFDLYPAAGPASTGCCVILVPGGGHRVLGVSGCTDLVTLFSARGISTAIVRCRLRVDGYDMNVDALNDTLRCISLVRANAAQWGLDPMKIGVVGMSAGAEHAASAATEYGAFEGGSNARPDFVGYLNRENEFAMVLTINMLRSLHLRQAEDSSNRKHLRRMSGCLYGQGAL